MATRPHSEITRRLPGDGGGVAITGSGLARSTGHLTKALGRLEAFGASLRPTIQNQWTTNINSLHDKHAIGMELEGIFERDVFQCRQKIGDFIQVVFS